MVGREAKWVAELGVGREASWAAELAAVQVVEWVAELVAAQVVGWVVGYSLGCWGCHCRFLRHTPCSCHRWYRPGRDGRPSSCIRWCSSNTHKCSEGEEATSLVVSLDAKLN